MSDPMGVVYINKTHKLLIHVVSDVNHVWVDWVYSMSNRWPWKRAGYWSSWIDEMYHVIVHTVMGTCVIDSTASY